ncbi:MAG: hypothetical protein KF752_01595 [Pirellulaceae bacterium]|nr:hypothetical protein [Pirellulaceae bacterium]
MSRTSGIEQPGASFDQAVDNAPVAEHLTVPVTAGWTGVRTRDAVESETSSAEPVNSQTSSSQSNNPLRPASGVKSIIESQHIQTAVYQGGQGYPTAENHRSQSETAGDARTGQFTPNARSSTQPSAADLKWGQQDSVTFQSFDRRQRQHTNQIAQSTPQQQSILQPRNSQQLVRDDELLVNQLLNSDEGQSDEADVTTAPPQELPAFPPQLGDDDSPADRLQPPSANRWPSKGRDSVGSDGSTPQSPDELEDILRSAREKNLPDCSAQRELLRGQPLSAISLDVSPKLSDGFRSASKSAEDQRRVQEKVAEIRKDFDRKSLRRDWTNYRGEPLASGRLIDLQYGNIVLDTGSGQRHIPIGDLSDVDMTYVAQVWNLPTRCGSGYEPLVGRDYIASTVQWKASGACHNPLYFEQVQLERYGHETGPVLQPLISSAHFFLTLPILPYKMGVHPPHECQYALGYFRPGSCAPYMVQPFPWSLRGGLAQAGVWTGASALIP